MKLIEADKVEQAIKDYWKAQVDKLPIPKSIEEHDAYVNRLDTILEYNSDLLKEIEALPSAEQDTTTHDSIPAETGKNDGDRTSGDLISMTQAIDMIKEIYEWHDSVTKERIIEHFKQLPSAQPDIIRCKDCIYQTESWSGIKYCEAHGDHIGKDYDYCSNARRKENGQTDFTAGGD